MVDAVIDASDAAEEDDELGNNSDVNADDVPFASAVSPGGTILGPPSATTAGGGGGTSMDADRVALLPFEPSGDSMRRPLLAILDLAAEARDSALLFADEDGAALGEAASDMVRLSSMESSSASTTASLTTVGGGSFPLVSSMFAILLGRMVRPSLDPRSSDCKRLETK